MDTVSFNLMQIIFEPNNKGERFVSPNVKIFETLQPTGSYTSNNLYYEVSSFIDENKTYLWMVFNFGKTYPRDEQVTNIKTEIKRNNDRKEDEVELLNQFFVYYAGSNTIYISDSRKKSMLIDYFKRILNIDVIIKHFYKTKEEIIESLQHINAIEFTHANDLFSDESKQKQALIDLTGCDAPVRFRIIANYNSKQLTPFIKHLMNAKTNQQIQDLVICGRNEEDFSFIYNNDSFCRKIDCTCNKNENGKFDEQKLLTVLINNINLNK